MRNSFRLLRQLKPLTSDFTFSSRSPAVYTLGLSYASKNSPPFVENKERAPRYGYAGYSGNDPGATLISEWVRSSMDRRAGRGDLTAAKAGGWDERLQDEVRRWGAGEDFFAVADLEEAPTASSSNDPPVHLAISDGVGGWSDVVDPSFFSQALMYHYAKSASSIEHGSPREILTKAYEKVLKEESVVAGSATACGIAVDSKGVLKGANLGDSGCCIIRDGQIVFETPSLTHYFNCPLTKVPKGMDAGGVVMDRPDSDKSSDTFEAQLQPRDLILLYTDGLSDNVPTSHFPLLLQHLDRVLSHPDNSDLSPAERDTELARLYADILVSYGRRAMLRTGEEVEENGTKSWKTPFEVESKKAGLSFRGGKIDDITVLATVVSELHPEE